MLERVLLDKQDQAKKVIKDIEEVSNENIGITSNQLMRYIQGEYISDVDKVMRNYSHLAMVYDIDRDISKMRRKFNNDY